MLNSYSIGLQLNFYWHQANFFQNLYTAKSRMNVSSLQFSVFPLTCSPGTNVDTSRSSWSWWSWPGCQCSSTAATRPMTWFPSSRGTGMDSGREWCIRSMDPWKMPGRSSISDCTSASTAGEMGCGLYWWMCVDFTTAYVFIFDFCPILNQILSSKRP